MENTTEIILEKKLIFMEQMAIISKSFQKLSEIGIKQSDVAKVLYKGSKFKKIFKAKYFIDAETGGLAFKSNIPDSIEYFKLYICTDDQSTQELYDDLLKQKDAGK